MAPVIILALEFSLIHPPPDTHLVLRLLYAASVSIVLQLSGILELGT
jgi:hypothetical protein